MARGTILRTHDEGGREIWLRVDSVEKDPGDKDGDVTLYGLSVRGAAGGWTPYCDRDSSGVALAIPVKGAWDSTGAYREEPGLMTFACTNGAIAKCLRWGYKPWKSIGGRSLRDYHLACVRMARADYCGDGLAHTRDGARIDVFDTVGIQEPEPRTGHPEVFEAGWSPEGATYVNVPRWSNDVDDLLQECPERLAGRTSRAEALTTQQVLERFPETLLLDNRFIHDADRGGKP